MSNYTIPIQLKNEENKYVLIHGYTGAMDVVTKSLYDKLKMISTSSNNLSSELLQTLIKRGYITTKTIEEEYAYVARIAKALHKESDILNTSFTWVVTYNCNFRCPYCFEGREKKDSGDKIVFTEKQVDIAYHALELIQPHKELRNNVITLYGGEPLLAENKSLITYIVNEGRKRGYRFIAVTNGYELDCFQDLLCDDGIYRVQVTIDGPKYIHNQRRIHYRDNNTFDKIIDNIKLALDKGIRVVVRMNSDGRNIEHYLELKSYLETRKFFTYSNFYIYVARLRDYYDISSFERENIEFMLPEEFNKKQAKIGANPFTLDTGYYRDIYNALLNKRAIPFRPVACKAQTSEYVLDPLGNIYPCWEVVGKKEHVKAVYSEEGIQWNRDVLNIWQDSDITTRDSCRKCQYALFCGGGCPYHRMLNKANHECYTFRSIFSNAINKAYAELIK